jgi:DNA polymerase-3 subunit epsilon
MHPGQKNSLDALCKRYEVNNSHRELHGALLDAEILADVYLLMTGGQTSLLLGGSADEVQSSVDGGIRRLPTERPRLKVVKVDSEEQVAHEARLSSISEASGGKCVWERGEEK